MISEVTSMKDVKKQAPLKTAVEPKVKNGIKVLVIEDEKALVDALVYNLDREGYEVTVAHDDHRLAAAAVGLVFGLRAQAVWPLRLNWR